MNIMHAHSKFIHLSDAVSIGVGNMLRAVALEAPAIPSYSRSNYPANGYRQSRSRHFVKTIR